MPRIFFDFEFTGLHQHTTPISLGIISDCDKTFYAEFSDYDGSQISPWIEENVIKKLRFSPPPKGQQNHFMASRAKNNPVGNDIYAGYNVELRGHKSDIRKELERWLSQFDSVEVWGDCLAYDWMLFCQIFGHAFSIPKNVHYIPFDLCALLKSRGIDPDINREDFARGGEYWYTEDQIQKHNALWDAKVIKACVDRIEKPLHQQQDRELYLTPRTDEQVKEWRSWPIKGNPISESFARQLEREVTELKWELLYCRNKLNAAQAEINQLKQKHAERVSDDQKYLVEPLCSAETQVDELREIIQDRDKTIAAIMAGLPDNAKPINAPDLMHIKTREKHPIFQLTKQLAEAQAEIERLNKECATCFNKRRDDLIRQMTEALKEECLNHCEERFDKDDQDCPPNDCRNCKIKAVLEAAEGV